MNVVIFYLLGIGTPAPHEVATAYLPPNLYLVRATTFAVWREPKEKFDRARLRVTEVIGGPERLQGSEFEASAESTVVFGTIMQAPKYPDTCSYPLEKGAEGLWWVTEDAKTGTLRPALGGTLVHDLCIQHFPYQKTKAGRVFTGGAEGMRIIGGKSDVELRREGEQWTKAVAEVYAAKTDADRRMQLEKYAAAEQTPVAGWAMALLARGPKDAAVKSLRPLVKIGKLEATSQVMLDELLCRLDPKEWKGCDARKAMFTRWLEPTAEDTHFQAGRERIRRAMPDDLDARMFVAILSGPVANIGQYGKEREGSIAMVLYYAKFRQADAGLGRGFLEQVKRSSPSLMLKSGATEALRHEPR